MIFKYVGNNLLRKILSSSIKSSVWVSEVSRIEFKNVRACRYTSIIACWRKSTEHIRGYVRSSKSYNIFSRSIRKKKKRGRHDISNPGSSSIIPWGVIKRRWGEYHKFLSSRAWLDSLDKRMAHEEVPGCLLINARREGENLKRGIGGWIKIMAGWKRGWRAQLLKKSRLCIHIAQECHAILASF